MIRLVLLGLLALSVSCSSKEVGRPPPSGDTRIPADSTGGGDTMTGDPMTGDPVAGDPIAGDPMTGDPIAPGDFANCTADGPHVSNTTCLASNQCGTVERPWCTIQGGIDNAAAGPILVAGVSGRPYTEAVAMADGVDVHGGWDTAFAARDSDPSSNGAVLVAGAVGFGWVAGTTATLDGFTITNSASTSIGTQIAVIADATAEVTLANVNMRFGNPVAASMLGVAIRGTGAGSLTMTDCGLELADATTVSSGVTAEDTFTGSVTLTDTTIVAGAANAGMAVALAGAGTLTITRGSYDGGASASFSMGVQVDTPAEVTLTDVTVHGGQGSRAIGVSAAGGADVSISGGIITGGGNLGLDLSSAAIGILSDGYGAITIDGTDIVGADPDSTGTGVLGSGIGVDVTGGADSIALVTISNATIEGGTLALARTGISVNVAMLDLQSSAVAGSTTTGGINVTGVSLTGFVATATHTISNNTSIIGGAPNSGNTGTYRAFAVFSTSAIPTTIAGNTLVQGCDPACDGPGLAANNPSSGAGVFIGTGQGHLVENNNLILGGPHTGTTTHTNHVGFSAGFGASIGVGGLVEVEISGNTSIAGNTDGTNRPANAVGVQGRDVDFLIDGNAEIFGGFGADNAAGVAVLFRTSGTNNVVVTNNDILGGAAATLVTALVVQGSNFTATDNFLDACGIPSGNPGPSPDCLAVLSSDGLVSQQNPVALIANNFAFGGYATSSDGCQITPPGAISPAGGGILAAYNLCLAISHASSGGLTRAEGLSIEGGTRLGYVFLNNIIGAGNRALVRLGVREIDPVTGITFENNDIMPDAGVSASGVALYLEEDGTELDDITAVNALDSRGAQFTYTDNVSADPAFDSPDLDVPSTAGYHLGSGCALRNLGQVVNRVDIDYDGDTRDDGTSAFPEIGPDECP